MIIKLKNKPWSTDAKAKEVIPIRIAPITKKRRPMMISVTKTLRTVLLQSFDKIDLSSFSLKTMLRMIATIIAIVASRGRSSAIPLIRTAMSMLPVLRPAIASPIAGAGGSPDIVMFVKRSSPPRAATVKPKVKKRGIAVSMTLKVISQILPKFSFMNINPNFILLVDDMAI